MACCCKCCVKNRKKARKKATEQCRQRFDQAKTCGGDPSPDDDQSYAEYLRRQKRRKIVRDREYPDYTDDWGGCLRLLPGTLSGRGASPQDEGCAEAVQVGTGLSLSGAVPPVLSCTVTQGAGNGSSSGSGVTTVAFVDVLTVTGANGVTGMVGVANDGAVFALNRKITLTDAWGNVANSNVAVAAGTILGSAIETLAAALFLVFPVVKAVLAVQDNNPGQHMAFRFKSGLVTT